MTLNLKDDAEIINKYKEYHRAVWPEVLDGLRGLGISKMKIFLHGRRMFMYLEAPDDFDVLRDFPKYMEAPRAKEWDELMCTFQERVPGAKPGEWWAAMEEVFDIDW
jgi:L-rhamnose mutarotase